MFGIIRVLLGQNRTDRSLLPLQNLQHNSPDSPPRFIDTSNAKVLTLPKLPTANEYQEQRPEHSKEYWDSYNKGISHYNRGWYEKAKTEFLKIYTSDHGNAYFTHLLRVYRKMYSAMIEKKKWNDALQIMNEMFEKCPDDITNTDIRAFNKVADQLGLDVPKKEPFEKTNEPEFTVDTGNIKIISEAKKPSKFKIEYVYEQTSLYRIYNQKQTLFPLLPHMHLEGDQISYRDPSNFPRIDEIAYRVKSVIGNRDSFVYSTEDLMLRVADWKFRAASSLNCEQYTQNKYHLRCVDMTGDLSKFVVTVVDRYFLLDKSLREIESWQVPYKIDTNDPSYQRRSTSRDSGTDGELHSALQTLGIEQDHPTADDVKQAFRSMTKQYHPDKNKDEDAEDRMKAILNAYDYIREHGLDGIDTQELEDDYWMKIVSRQTFNAGGFQMTVEMGISVDPSDWIYATGMSQNGDRLYLGCYSGKVYEVSQGGIAHAVYVVPNAEPIREILENGVFLYILTYSHLYIVDREDHSFLRSIQIHDNQRATGYIKFGEDGFVHVLNYSVRGYATDGTELWSITFDNAPKYVCMTTDNRYAVETGKKLYLLDVNV